MSAEHSATPPQLNPYQAPSPAPGHDAPGGQLYAPYGVGPEEVIELVRAGVDDELIVNHILSHGACRPPNTAELIRLKQENVSVLVIQALQEQSKKRGFSSLSPEVLGMSVKGVLLGTAATLGVAFGGGFLLGLFFAVLFKMSGAGPDGMQMFQETGYHMGVILAISMAGTLLGGYVAVWVADKAEVRHALAVGVILLVLSVLTFATSPRALPTWVYLLEFSLIVPVALLGGYLRVSRLRDRALGA